MTRTQLFRYKEKAIMYRRNIVFLIEYFFIFVYFICCNLKLAPDRQVFDNCSCIPEFHKATDGACAVDCSEQFLIFLVLLCTMKFFSSTGRSGNTIIQFRSVAPEDKSVSIALTEVLVCAVAFIPAPIIYGVLLDSSCLVWGETCGVTGNCWLYNGQILRYLLNFTASGFLLVATLLDVGVLCSVGNLKIYDEEFVEQPKDENGEVPPESDFPLLHKNID